MATQQKSGVAVDETALAAIYETAIKSGKTKKQTDALAAQKMPEGTNIRGYYFDWYKRRLRRAAQFNGGSPVPPKK